MGHNVTTVIPIFGDTKYWAPLAVMAEESAYAAGSYQVLITSGGTLAEARNNGLALVDTEFVCFLDADDTLAPNYFNEVFSGPDPFDVAVPSAQYFSHENKTAPTFLRVLGHNHSACSPACLSDGNYIVIGAPVRTSMAVDVKGFKDFAWCEDWDFWLRLRSRGAAFKNCPNAVYQAHKRPGSRNNIDDETASALSFLILRSNGLA